MINKDNRSGGMSSRLDHFNGPVSQIKNIAVVQRINLHGIPVCEIVILFNLIPVFRQGCLLCHFKKLLFPDADTGLEKADVTVMNPALVKMEIASDMIGMRMRVDKFDGFIRQSSAECFQVPQSDD